MAQRQNWRVLVFPGGMENGIEIYNSLKQCKEVTLFSASSNVPNQAFYLYKNNNIVADIHRPDWVDDLNKVIEKNKIDIVYPANSLIIDALSAQKNNIKAKILLPGEHVLNITRSKKRTIAELQDVIPTPVVYNSIEEITSYPVFIKPDNGYGAQGARQVDSEQDLADINFNDFVVQELLTGKEYTVDCLSDNDGKLLFSSGRERSRIRMATSMHAEAVSEKLDEFFASYAEKILEKIKISGAWFFQMKEDKKGNLKLLEIDVRIAGTMCYNRCKGVNFPLLSLYLFYNLPVSLNINNVPLFLDRCLKNRYILKCNYKTVYIDLDDTIVFREQINTDIIKFLYQCINQNKRLILITKHEGKREEYLKKWRISELFDEIIWLKEDDKKSDYMKEKEAIYIDDSFSQRQEVVKALGIPTFDASMIEALIDERI